MTTPKKTKSIFKPSPQIIDDSSSEESGEESQELDCVFSKALLQEMVYAWLDAHALELMQEKFTIQAKTTKKKKAIDVFGLEDKNGSGKKVKFED